MTLLGVDRAVCKGLGYGCEYQGVMVRLLIEARNSSFLDSIQTGCLGLSSVPKFFSGGLGGRGVKTTTYLRLVPSLEVWKYNSTHSYTRGQFNRLL